MPNPNVGAAALGAFDPKANGIEPALVVFMLVTVGAEGVVVFAVAPNANMDGVPAPNGFGAALDGVPNETFALVVIVGGLVAGLPKLNVTGADVV